jgi:hypothetical protein
MPERDKVSKSTHKYCRVALNAGQVRRLERALMKIERLVATGIADPACTPLDRKRFKRIHEYAADEVVSLIARQYEHK